MILCRLGIGIRGGTQDDGSRQCYIHLCLLFIYHHSVADLADPRCDAVYMVLVVRSRVASTEPTDLIRGIMSRATQIRGRPQEMRVPSFGVSRWTGLLNRFGS